MSALTEAAEGRSTWNAGSPLSEPSSVPDALPPELTAFLQEPGGVSLSIRGQPGTGKTSLALEALVRLGGERFFLTTRVGSGRLHQQFRWLSGELGEAHIVDMASLRSEILLLKPDVGRVGKLLFRGDAVPSTIDVERFMTLPPPVQEIFSLMPDAPGGSTIMIDSWEALVADYASRVRGRNEDGLSEAELAEALLALFGAHRSNVVFVRETSDPNAIDYLVDGVIEAHRDLIDGRVYRSLHFTKMRGIALESPSVPFTLNEGRFRAISPAKSFVARPSPGTAPVEDPEPPSQDGYSWGHEDMDRHLGPIAFGSVIYLESATGVPSALAERIASDLSCGRSGPARGCACVLPLGVSPAHSTPPPSLVEVASDHLRVVFASRSAPEPVPPGWERLKSSLSPFVLGQSKVLDSVGLLNLLTGGLPRPMFFRLSLPMLLTMTGGNWETVEAALSMLIRETRSSGGLMVVMNDRGGPCQDYLSSQSTHHLKLLEAGGVHLLYRVHHPGPLIAFARGPGDGSVGSTKLVPMV